MRNGSGPGTEWRRGIEPLLVTAAQAAAEDPTAGDHRKPGVVAAEGAVAQAGAENLSSPRGVATGTRR